MMNKIELITPDWLAPPGVQACCTTRTGGVSAPPFNTLNLATHVQDSETSVLENRRRLSTALALPTEPFWLNQVHGTIVAQFGTQAGTQVESQAITMALPNADAAFTDQPNTVLAILTADCLSVLFACKKTGEIAAAHAGWRGLAAGVLEATLAKFSAPPEQIMAWLGPAIGPAAFVVGDEVRRAFVSQHRANSAGFTPSRAPGKYHADLFLIAKLRLARAGVLGFSGGGLCTFSDAQLFSYRRDQGTTGRMATLIWRT